MYSQISVYKFWVQYVVALCVLYVSGGLREKKWGFQPFGQLKCYLPIQ